MAKMNFASPGPGPRRKRRGLGFQIAFVLSLILAGCGSNNQGPLPPCPAAFPVAEARELTRFSGQGRDLTDVLFEAQVQDMALICGYLDDVIEVDMRIRIMAVDGPANESRVVRFAYFVAIATLDRKIVAREEFNLEVPFEGNRTRVVAIEEVAPRIPLQAGQNGDDYVIYVGLALTPAELRYNQENR